MRKQSLILIAIFIVGVFAFAQSASALGVTPGKTTLSFEPGKEKTVTFTVVNSEHKSSKISLAVRGDLGQYVALPYESFDITAAEGSKDVSVKINLPSTVPPGQHTAEIVVLQIPKEVTGSGETQVSAFLAVVTQIQVNIPYPGKFAEVELRIEQDKNGKIDFLMPVHSKGSFDLTSVKAVIDVYTSLNEKVATLSTKSDVGIPSGQSKELVIEWNPKVNPGPYRAVATILYDENTLTIEKTFTVGERKLNLQNVQVKDFTLGQIAKFELLVESKWSEKISGVYSQTKVLDAGGNILADFKSPTYDIEPLKKILMVSYWDTAGVKENTYDSVVLLHYANETEDQSLKLEVKKNSIKAIGIGYVISEDGSATNGGSSSLVTILIVVVVILVLLNLSWFFYFRKKLKK